MQSETQLKTVFRYVSGPVMATSALFLGLGLPQSALSNPIEPPQVVESIDLPRYMGRWFEIASNRPAFQADCFCTTAEYALVLQPDGSPKVDVKNSCNRGNADGSLSVAIGSATIPDANTAGKLTVQFGPFAPPETNYWIVALAEDYTWAVVSSKTRSPLYLLGRERSLPQSTIDQVVADLTARGFNTAILDFTVQNGCR